MDPAVKIILDEMQQRFSDELRKGFSEHDEKWDRRFLDLEHSQGARLDRLEDAAQVFDEWRPRIEATVDDVKLELGKVTRFWDRSLRERGVQEPPIFPSPQSAMERSPAPPGVDGPAGHRVDPTTRDDGFGSVLIHSHIPAKGACSRSTPPPTSSGFSRDNPSLGKLPKLHFHRFDGDNPKLWISRCEDYFEMYLVDSSFWVRLALNQLDGPAARWSQSVSKRLKQSSWSEFCSLLLERFGRDQQESLIRQLYHIKQTSTVADYVDRFSELVDQLIAYEHTTDPMYYTIRFLDGLRDDIRSVVQVQRPSTLDTACSLALLQEEVAGPASRRDARRPDAGFQWRPPPPKGPLPLPAPPRVDKPPAPSLVSADDKHAADPGKQSVDKFAALKAYRRARGLCDKCAERWRPGHQCASTVQLHVVQELMDLLSPDVGDHAELSDSADTCPGSSSSSDQAHLFATISLDALAGSDGPKTMRFLGSLQGQDILILVDSGSTHSFLSDSVAAHLQGVQPLPRPIRVQVANGAVLQCSHHLPNAFGRSMLTVFQPIYGCFHCNILT